MDSQPLNFKISTCLRKPMPLPAADKFHIHHEDLLVADKILCYNKARGLIFDHVSPLADRFVSLTRHGYLVVYMGTTKGFILDVRRAERVSSVTDSFKKRRIMHRRCHLKIKFSFGSFNIFLLDNKINEWRRHIGNAFDGYIMESKETCTQSLDDTLDLDLATEQMFPTDVNNSASSNSIPSVLRSDPQVSSIENCTQTDNNTRNKETNDSRTGSYVSVVEETMPKPLTGHMSVDKSSRVVRSKKLDEKTFDGLLANFDKMAPVPKSSNEKQDVPIEAYKDLGRNISLKSVRCGTIPVATLRKRLETKVMKRKKDILEEKTEVESNDVSHCPRYGKPLMCPEAACQPDNFARAAGLSKSSPSLFRVSEASLPVSSVESHLVNVKFGIKTLSTKFDVLKNKKTSEPNNSLNAISRFSLAVPSTSRCESHA